MRIIIDGEELEARTLMTASTRAVQALQRQTGLKMAELLAKGQDHEDIDHETWSLKVIEFLTEHTRGRCVKWDKLWDRPMPGIFPDADEARRAKEDGEDDEGPTPARTDSPADAAPAAPAAAAKTRKSHGSSKKNRGSKTKSGRGPSTS